MVRTMPSILEQTEESSQFRKSKLTASSLPSQLQVSCPWHATWPQAISRAVCAPQEVHSARGEAEVSGEGSSAASSRTCSNRHFRVVFSCAFCARCSARRKDAATSLGRVRRSQAWQFTECPGCLPKLSTPPGPSSASCAKRLSCTSSGVRPPASAKVWSCGALLWPTASNTSRSRPCRPCARLARLLKTWSLSSKSVYSSSARVTSASFKHF
mmetsp:Transcript_55933/g.113890  ORF Transcript_55933/g.113890 Transcript_55933/m.113890 type:complete len:213 (-) Transcript_55933:1002-1640(-)